MKQISAAAALLIGAKAIKYVPEKASFDADKPLYYTVPDGWWPSEKAALNAKKSGYVPEKASVDDEKSIYYTVDGWTPKNKEDK